MYFTRSGQYFPKPVRRKTIAPFGIRPWRFSHAAKSAYVTW
jgi:hypothetical protein